jgi:hypothetical protein
MKLIAFKDHATSGKKDEAFDSGRCGVYLV